MAVENQALDLGKLASGTNGRVAAMLAELEGHALDSGERGSPRTPWTQQFVASGKRGKAPES
jgi:hypothetical protein